MGKWKYRKREPSNVRGICVVCDKNPQKRVASTNKYKPICSPCSKRIYEPNYRNLIRKSKDNRKRPYRKFVKNNCQNCGFSPEDKCQLDVDHIDGNHKNNAPENLQTLCANCHRLKTLRERQNHFTSS